MTYRIVSFLMVLCASMATYSTNQLNISEEKCLLELAQSNQENSVDAVDAMLKLAANYACGYFELNHNKALHWYAQARQAFSVEFRTITNNDNIFSDILVFLEEAAEEGCIGAYYALSRHYEYGVGCTRDLETAISYLQNLALIGDHEGMAELECFCKKYNIHY
jgi:TPR repeat protein